MAYMVGLLALMLLYTNATLTTSVQYTIAPQRALPGWSYQLVKINRLQCLLACLRKIYCLSVNYNNHDKVCQINQRQQGDTSTDNFKQNSSFDYIEKVLDKDFKNHGVHFGSSLATFKEAYDICNENLGDLASYEHVYNAFQPQLDNCSEGWLLGGEVAFTEISNKCALKSPDKRSNIFPCKTYYSGYYCYKKYNNSLDTFDKSYIPTNQRIIRLAGTNSNKLKFTESDECCSMSFGGRLATPFEVYFVWYSMDVGHCGNSWYLGRLNGELCYTATPSDFWLYPFGNLIKFRELDLELFGMCYIPLPNEILGFPDPYPPHRVISVEGHGHYTLTYQDALTKCTEHGGTLATRAQVENAYNAGYDCCYAGWIESGEVVYPIVYQSGEHCSNSGVGVRSWGYPDPQNTYGGYCYIS